MKKFVSIILTLVTALAVFTPAFAYDDITEETSAYVEQAVTETYEETDIYEETGDSEDALPSEAAAETAEDEEGHAETVSGDELVEEKSGAKKLAAPEAQNAADEAGAGEESVYEESLPVAYMYLCASGPHAPYLFGHAWICIENISDEDIVVDGETLEPGKIMSMGLHSGRGMTHNEEMHDYRGKTVKAKKTALRRSDLATAENEICSSRWHSYELFTHNCTNFATSVWRKTTGQSFLAFCFPFIVSIQMAFSGGTTTLAI